MRNVYAWYCACRVWSEPAVRARPRTLLAHWCSRRVCSSRLVHSVRPARERDDRSLARGVRRPRHRGGPLRQASEAPPPPCPRHIFTAWILEIGFRPGSYVFLAFHLTYIARAVCSLQRFPMHHFISNLTQTDHMTNIIRKIPYT